MPREIAPLVRDVSLDDLIVVRTVDQSARTAPQIQRDAQGRVTIPFGSGGIRPDDSSGNLVNGNFPSGSLKSGWIDESSSGNSVTATTTSLSEHLFGFHGHAAATRNQRVGIAAPDWSKLRRTAF